MKRLMQMMFLVFGILIFGGGSIFYGHFQLNTMRENNERLERELLQLRRGKQAFENIDRVLKEEINLYERVMDKGFGVPVDRLKLGRLLESLAKVSRVEELSFELSPQENKALGAHHYDATFLRVKFQGALDRDGYDLVNLIETTLPGLVLPASFSLKRVEDQVQGQFDFWVVTYKELL